MSTQEVLEGKLSSVEYVGDSKGGWKRYNVVFEDGESQRVIIPPDVKKELTVGSTEKFYKGTYNSWVLDNGDVAGNKASDSNGQVNKNGYWEGRADYEMHQRDPKIEFKSYFGFVTQLYVAAIPHLTEPPKTTSDLDAYIDDAYAKTAAIYERRQKETAKKNV